MIKQISFYVNDKMKNDSFRAGRTVFVALMIFKIIFLFIRLHQVTLQHFSVRGFFYNCIITYKLNAVLVFVMNYIKFVINALSLNLITNILTKR